MKWNSDEIRDKGLMELYLLDELNKEDRLALEHALDKDYELLKELRQLEAEFEKLGFENAVEPPKAVKTALLSQISSSDDNSKAESEVISLDNKSRSRTYFFMAASIAALLLLNSIWMFTQWQSTQEQLEVLRSESENLKTQLAGIESEFEETSKWYAMINDPDVQKFIMNGNSKSPESVAVAYLNESEKTVVLKANGLSPLDGDKTYQMWADVEGEMIDMGVIPSDAEMVTLQYIANAESFNITIEPKGGNDHPTVESLITNVIL